MKKHKWYYGFIIVFSFLTTVIWTVCIWYNKTFGVKLQELMFTLVSPLEGADIGFVLEGMFVCIPVIFFGLFLSILIVWGDKVISKKFSILVRGRIFNRGLVLDLIKFSRMFFVFIVTFGFIAGVLYVNKSLEVTDYIKQRLNPTYLYEEYYVSPKSVNITSKKEPKNLLFIYMESMETTYASLEDGGEQEINYIPNLSKLAEENVSFSDEKKLGGFQNTSGTGWTMASIMATTSGVPYAFPVEGNSMSDHENFAPGLVALGDILKDKGYYQEFLCGSDATFGGRSKYFTEHGEYEIFDYYTAIDKKYIADDYKVFWGIEDKILYEIAKDELLRVSKQEKPFNFTMLTVDTHHVEGYVCDLCKSEYPEQTANVVKCADKQIYDFIEWCKTQEFYKNTVIVIVGDHPRMDKALVEGVDSEKRTMYNCFINSEQEVLGSDENRIWTPMDILPTTLSAMGYEISGERLALGTNMFSKKQTLAEEVGMEYLNEELRKNSKYYENEFLHMNIK